MPESPTDPSGQLPRGRHGLPREVIAESQRQRILAAMVEVVAERGYAEATIADVIGVAGVSRKTFYELFADKEDCFLAAYDEQLRILVERTTAAYEARPGAPWAERLRLALTAFLGALANNPAPARYCIVESLAAGPKALARRDSAMRQFTHFVDAGRAEASFELPGITALTLIGGVEELLYTEIIHGATAQLPAQLPDLVFCLTSPFLGPERAAAERDHARGLLRRAPTLAAVDDLPETSGEGNGGGEVSAEPSEARAAAPSTPAG